MKNILTILISVIILGVIFFGCKKDEGPAAVGPITVSGFVKDLYGIPVANAAVVITGKTPVTTGASGEFSIPNVTTPYDISLIVSSSKLAVLYKGLSRSDPKLLYFGYSGGTTNSATINGTVPAASGKNTRVIFSSGSQIYSTYADQTTGTYSLPFYWIGTVDSVVGKLYILRYTTNVAGLPVDYDAYKDTSLTLKNGITSSGLNFAASNLSDPQDSNIGGTVTRNSSYSLSYSRALYIKFNGGLIRFGTESSPASDAFSYHVPSISGMTFGVYASANKTSTPSNLYSNNYKTGITAGSMNVNVTLEAAPQLALPLNSATNVDTLTNFTWSQGGGSGVNLVAISPNSSSYPYYYIFTTGSNLNIQNYSALALGLPPSIAYTWQVYKFFPVTSYGGNSASIDNSGSDQFRKLFMFALANYGCYPSDLGFSISERFTFTTKP
jgi:hypothetical protein